MTEQEGPMGPAREADMNLTVSDLFQQGSNELQNLLPHLKEKIKAIKPSLSGLRIRGFGWELQPENTQTRLAIKLQSKSKRRRPSRKENNQR